MKLGAFRPFAKKLQEDLAALCAKCSLILCDITPLGIAVAQYAGFPSILVEKYPKLQSHV